MMDKVQKKGCIRCQSCYVLSFFIFDLWRWGW